MKVQDSEMTGDINAPVIFYHKISTFAGKASSNYILTGKAEYPILTTDVLKRLI